jgi:endoglucanase
LEDADYRQDVIDIVDHVGTKPGVYVMVSLWIDPSFTAMGWPSSSTTTVWEELAAMFADDGHVLFGLVNEPESNFDGALDVDVWNAMNDTVAAIRAVEDANGGDRHVIAVQGTGGWSRFLSYYVENPITAGGGENIAYEAHVYDPPSAWPANFLDASATLPVIVGEYGPADGFMTLDDVDAFWDEMAARDIPHLAWTFHMRCPPNLLVDNSGGGCGVDMTLEPTEWGLAFQAWLATDW